MAAAETEMVLLDWDLPGLLTDGAVAELRRLCPAAAFIALSTRDEQRPARAGNGRGRVRQQERAAGPAADSAARCRTRLIPQDHNSAGRQSRIPLSCRRAQRRLA